jgi:DNA-binding NarL/FixJ family response regulator
MALIKILLVDDDEMVRDSLSEVLEHYFEHMRHRVRVGKKH